MLKVLIATGGTGGHLFPAQQLAQMLTGCNVLFAGHKLESTPFFDRKIPFCEIASSSKKKEWFSILKGFWQSIRLLLRYSPDVVVGFGSFHSLPVLLAAVLLRKKIVLFEANCSLGKVNRLFSRFAKKVAFQFPVKEKGVYVPLLPWVAKESAPISSEVARSSYHLDPKVLTILVFGGSQGATFINETFCAAALILHGKGMVFQVIHFTGNEAAKINYPVPAAVKVFEKEMAKAYAAADLVVCRCGAGTTADLIRYRKPAILIPYPYAHDHQRKNGEFLKEGARMLLQKETNPEMLAREIEAMCGELPMRKEALGQITLPKTVDFAMLVRAVGEER